MSHRGAVRTVSGVLLLLGAAGTLDQQSLAQAPQALAPLLTGALLAGWGGARLTGGPTLPRLQAALRALAQSQSMTKGEAL